MQQAYVPQGHYAFNCVSSVLVLLKRLQLGMLLRRPWFMPAFLSFFKVSNQSSGAETIL